jgi:hypothetical protein
MANQLTPDDLDELKALRQVFDYSASLKRLEDYGKWVFAAVASIATLGAGFSNVAFKTLNGPAKVIFVIAVIMAGVSLSSAALLLLPQWQAVNRWSRDSMRNALQMQFKNRRIYTGTAGLLLSSALVLAGIAPAVSALFPDCPAVSKLSYVSSKGNLEVTLSLARVAPDSDATLTIERVDSQKARIPVARAELHVDQSGVGTRTIQVSTVPGTYELSYTCKASDGKQFQSAPEVLTITAVAGKPDPASSVATDQKGDPK